MADVLTIKAVSCIRNASGLVQSGWMSITPTDANDQPIPARAGLLGPQFLAGAVPVPIAKGSITGSLQFPNPTATGTSPQNVKARIEIVDTTQHMQTTTTTYSGVDLVDDGTGHWDFAKYDSGLATGSLPVTVVTGPAGPPGPASSYRGVWQATTIYQVADVVQYNGSSYVSRCINNADGVQGALPADGNGVASEPFWSLVASQGEQGKEGPKGVANPLGDYDPAREYSLGDLVTLDGSSYFSKLDANTGNIPGTAGTVTTYGTVSVAVNQGSLAGAAIMLPYQLAVGALTSFTCDFESHTAGGTLTLYVLSDNGDGTFTITDTFTVSPSATGKQTFVAGTDFPARNVAAGQRIAYYSTTELVGLNNTAGPGYYYVVDGGSLTTTHAWTNAGAIATICFAVSVAEPSASWMLIAAKGETGETGETGPSGKDGVVDAPKLVSSGRTLLEHTRYGGAFPTGWTFPTGWASTANGAQSPSSGTSYGMTAYGGVILACDRRTYRVAFTLDAAGTVFCVGAQQPVGVIAADPNLGTSILFDAVNNALTLQNAWITGQSNTGTAITVPLGFTPALAMRYVLEIALNIRELTVTVYDPATGVSASLTSGNNATSTGFYQSDGAAAGLMLDQLCYRWVSGQYTVQEHWITGDVQAPRALIMGDSIAHAFKLGLADAWAHNLRQGIGNSVLSGRSGANSALTVSRLASELNTYLPQYLVLMIGTNDLSASGNLGLAALQANVATIIVAAKAVGTEVVVCTLPAASGRPQSDIDAYNAWLLARTDIHIIHMDKALPTALTQDGVHPTAAGGAAMLARAHADVPWLFDAVVRARQMPVFAGGGPGHSAGAVPDPGATAGTTRYLCETGTWQVPAGSSTSTTGTMAAQNAGAVAITGGTATLTSLTLADASSPIMLAVTHPNASITQVTVAGSSSTQVKFAVFGGNFSGVQLGATGNSGQLLYSQDGTMYCFVNTQASGSADVGFQATSTRFTVSGDLVASGGKKLVFNADGTVGWTSA